MFSVVQRVDARQVGAVALSLRPAAIISAAGDIRCWLRYVSWQRLCEERSSRVQQKCLSSPCLTFNPPPPPLNSMVHDPPKAEGGPLLHR